MTLLSPTDIKKILNSSPYMGGPFRTLAENHIKIQEGAGWQAI